MKRALLTALVGLAASLAACSPSPDRFCRHMEKLGARYADDHPKELDDHILPSDTEIGRMHDDCVRRIAELKKEHEKSYDRCIPCMMKLDRLEDQKECKSECKD